MHPRNGAVSAATRLVCLLGHPVAHSVSPEMHNAAFAATGTDAVYLAFDVPPDGIDAVVEGLATAGFLGANATVPHKRALWRLADARTPEAELVGAANTLFHRGRTLVADNTDACALQAVLEAEVGLEAADEVVLFGAGGAARAAAVALGRLRARVEVRARRAEAAAEVSALMTASGATATAVARPRCVLNATPLGLRGEALPADLMRLGPGQAALDLVYGPVDTPFLAAARERGAVAIDGLGMLVGQAALAFTHWTGRPAPVETMRAAAARALGRAG